MGKRKEYYANYYRSRKAEIYEKAREYQRKHKEEINVKRRKKWAETPLEIRKKMVAEKYQRQKEKVFAEILELL